MQEKILLDDNVLDSVRGACNITTRTKQVDPRFHTMSLQDQIFELGHQWIGSQQKIFDNILNNEGGND